MVTYKKNFRKFVIEKVSEEITTIDIWFQDEARIGQQGTLSRIWAIKGTIDLEQFDSNNLFHHTYLVQFALGVSITQC